MEERGEGKRERGREGVEVLGLTASYRSLCLNVLTSICFKLLSRIHTQTVLWRKIKSGAFTYFLSEYGKKLFFHLKVMIHFVAKFVAQSLCFKFANTQNTQTDAEKNQ